MRRIAALVGAVAVAAPAAAHGPCECLSPASGPPGTVVQAGYPSFKVVFNPDRADLGIGPESLWRAHHGPPPVTVLRRLWRYGRRYPEPRFAVPDGTPPGRYLVALYDGDEGGAHYSWEAFRVTAAQADAVPLAVGTGESDAPAVPVWLAAVAGLCAGLAAALGIVRLRRRKAP